MKNLKYITGIILLLLIGVICLVRYTDYQHILTTIQNIKLLPTGYATLFLIAGLAAYAGRWWELVGRRSPYLYSFHTSNLGHAGNILTPFRVGEPARIIVMAAQVGRSEAATSYGVERTFEQFLRLGALGLSALLGLNVWTSSYTYTGAITVIAIVLTIFWALQNQTLLLNKVPSLLGRLPFLQPDSIRSFMAGVLSNLTSLSKPQQFALVLFWNLLTWGLFWCFHYFAIQALDDAFIGCNKTALALAALALVPPSSPTAPGLYHASLIIPLHLVGYPVDELTSWAILMHLIQMSVMLPLGLWGAWATKSSRGNKSYKKLSEQVPTR